MQQHGSCPVIVVPSLTDIEVSASLSCHWVPILNNMRLSTAAYMNETYISPSHMPVPVTLTACVVTDASFSYPIARPY